MLFSRFRVRSIDLPPHNHVPGLLSIEHVVRPLAVQVLHAVITWNRFGYCAGGAPVEDTSSVKYTCINSDDWEENDYSEALKMRSSIFVLSFVLSDQVVTQSQQIDCVFWLFW